jgi:tetraacyldisaccharide 4'-kinase
MREGEWRTLDGTPSPPPDGAPLVVTAIATPEPFAALVTARVGALSGHRAFPDHHVFTRDDAARLRKEAGNGWIATTEKDAVKLSPLRELLPEVRVLPLVPDHSAELAETIFGSLSRPGKRVSEA